MTADETQETPRPVLRVLSGSPTPEEVAAIVALLTGASSGEAPSAGPAPTTSLWRDASRAAGHRLAPGPGAWRASGLPR